MSKQALLEKKKSLPYEIHITVKLTENQTIDEFKSSCHLLGVKPIVLELQLAKTNTLTDVMTSSKHLGDNTSAYNTSKELADSLSKLGFNVVRQKIETVPWHPASPKTNNDIMPKNCYFESHLGIVCDSSRKEILTNYCNSNQLHLSRNIFKKVKDESYIIMATIRSHNTYEAEFKTHISKIRKELKEMSFEVDKEIIEFAIYDTKVSHDDEWLRANSKTPLIEGEV